MFCELYNMEHATFAIGMQSALHPLLCNYHVRLGTFTNWPASRSQTKYQLAEAGFFYKGISDEVHCFYCGLCLVDWIDENPWEEHARYGDNCFYLLTIKGDNYPQIVRQRSRDIAQSGNEIPIIVMEALSPSSQNLQEVIERVSTSIPSTSGENVAESDDVGSSKSTVKDIKCIICHERERNILFWPCLHVATCSECAEKLDNICLICRDIIEFKCPVHIV